MMKSSRLIGIKIGISIINPSAAILSWTRVWNKSLNSHHHLFNLLILDSNWFEGVCRLTLSPSHSTSINFLTRLYGHAMKGDHHKFCDKLEIARIYYRVWRVIWDSSREGIMYGRVDPEGRPHSCWSSPPPYSRHPRALRHCHFLSVRYQTQ